MKLRIKRLNTSAILPTRAKPGDSGLDLYACLPGGPIHISPGQLLKLGTGVAIELPTPIRYEGLVASGYEAQVRGRSGLAARGIIACGGIGTVDNGYRGEIGVVLLNTSAFYFPVNHGDRIAQLVVAPVIYPELEEVTELSGTARGVDGFGSTGV